ncbi:stage V sporulation protein B [Bacillus spongiae]|uniref:Stage V sporulation protein B n=1 Tax=Bacillus spongiae TaxID=2683610 RepID=A0ABU8H8Y5_9BACI
MSKFFKGTMILMLAAFITRILGFINRIVVTKLIGEEGVGLYMMAFPTLVLVITITQLGLPVAISKSVAEAEAQKNTKKIKKILAVSLGVTTGLSLIFTPALILLAPFLSDVLFTDNRIYYPLVAIAPVIPIIAVSSVIRGYFQGRQNMKPAAISQVIEQVVRIILIAAMTKAFLPYGIEYAAAGAMAASVFGELASLVYMFTMFKMKKKFPVRRNFFNSLAKGKETLTELLTVAIPTTGSRLIGSLSWFFEPIIVSYSLYLAGVTTIAATKQYGSLTGYALPLLFLPSFITVSLSTSLVPAISEAYSQKRLSVVGIRLQEALRFSLVTGGLAVVLLFIFAYPLMETIYGSTKAAPFIKLMAPFFLFYYYQGPLQAVLQALNLARAAMINSLIGAAAKLGLIFILASQPAFGIYGAAISIVVGFMLVTLLHFATMLKVIPMSFYVKDYIKLAFIGVLVVIGGTWSYEHLFTGNATGVRLLLGLSSVSLLYCFLLYLFGLITKQDLKRIPFVNRYIH